MLYKVIPSISHHAYASINRRRWRPRTQSWQELISNWWQLRQGHLHRHWRRSLWTRWPCHHYDSGRKRRYSWNWLGSWFVTDRWRELPKVAVGTVALTLVGHSQIVGRPTPLSPQPGGARSTASLLLKHGQEGCLLLTATCQLFSLPHQPVGCGCLAHN